MEENKADSCGMAVERELTIRDFESQAKGELRMQAGDIAVAKIKERLKEIAKAKKVLSRLESQYEELLAKNLDDFVAELPSASECGRFEFFGMGPCK